MRRERQTSNRDGEEAAPDQVGQALLVGASRAVLLGLLGWIVRKDTKVHSIPRATRSLYTI